MVRCDVKRSASLLSCVELRHLIMSGAGRNDSRDLEREIVCHRVYLFDNIRVNETLASPSQSSDEHQFRKQSIRTWRCFGPWRWQVSCNFAVTTSSCEQARWILYSTSLSVNGAGHVRQTNNRLSLASVQVHRITAGTWYHILTQTCKLTSTCIEIPWIEETVCDGVFESSPGWISHSLPARPVQPTGELLHFCCLGSCSNAVLERSARTLQFLHTAIAYPANLGQLKNELLLPIFSSAANSPSQYTGLVGFATNRVLKIGRGTAIASMRLGCIGKKS